MTSKNNIDLKAILIGSRSDLKAHALAKIVLEKGIEKELVTYALDKDPVLSSRAMWVVDHCGDLDHERIKPFHSQLINNLKNKNLSSGSIRRTLSLFQEHSVPVKHESFMLDTCFAYIKNPSEAIAVRAFAITVVFNISKPYPELLKELEMVLLHLVATEDSPATRARIKNTIKAIHRLALVKKQNTF